MSEQDPERLADELEGEADRLEQEQSGRLQDDVDDVRQDWERKRADGSVPGANPPQPGEGERGDQSAWGRESESESDAQK